MRVNRRQYDAARTQRILNQLPPWIDKSSESRLFKWLNVLGREGELIEENLTFVRNDLNPYHLNPDQPTNIKRVDDIPKSSGPYQYQGKKGQYIFDLKKVDREKDFLDNIPTRLSEKADSQFKIDNTTVTAEGLCLRYIENLPGLGDGFVLITVQHPIDSTFFNLIDKNGNVISSSSIGRETQSYDVVGYDEEVRFENNMAELRYRPIWTGGVSSLVVKDVLNLDTNGNPTDVTSKVSLNGKQITWIDANPPTGRYIAEYEYSAYEGIRSIIPNQSRWGIGYNYADNFTDVSFLKHNGYTYNPDISTSLSDASAHLITGTNQVRNASIVDFYPSVSGQNTTYYLRLNPLEVRAGRTVTVKLTGSNIYSTSWTASDTAPLQIDMPTTVSNFIETHPSAVQIFDATSGADISENFIRSVDNNGVVTVEIESTSTYNGANVTVNVYYKQLFTATLTASNETSASMETNGVSVYYSQLDVTSLVDSSMTIPDIGDFTVEVPEEYVARVNIPVPLLVNDQIQQVTAYLEKFNQAIHFIGDQGDLETVYLLNMIPDSTTGIYTTDLDNSWEYRDMILKDDYLVLLKTLVDTSSTDYLKKAPGNGGKSTIEFWDFFQRQRETFFENVVPNAVSLTLGPDNTIYVLALEKDKVSGNYENWIHAYHIAYDYIYEVDKGNTYTVFIREDIDELLADGP